MTSAGLTRDVAPEVLLLTVGQEVHAVSIGVVREVVPYATVTPVPDAPRWLDGLVNLRGDVLPVVDSGRCLGVAGGDDRTHLVVTDTTAGPAALVACATPRPGRLGDRVGPGRNLGARAQYVVDDAVCTLLDLDELTGQGGAGG